MRALPTWRIWTIDTRLRQFRHVENYDTPKIKIIEFDSEEGHEIFEEYCQERYDRLIEEASSYQRIVFDIEGNTFDEEDANNLAEGMEREYETEHLNDMS